MDFCRLKLCEIFVQICNLKIGPLSHLNDFHVFPRDNILKTFTAMHYPVFGHKDTLSFAFLVCIILKVDGKQNRCFTFVQYSIVFTGCFFSSYGIL